MAVGLTVVEPMAVVEVKVPGVMAMDVAPVVDQLRVVLAPEVMLVGLALKQQMSGVLSACTVTVAVAVTAPDALVALSV